MQGTIIEVAGKSVAATVVPKGDRTPDEWASYCNAARGKAVEAIIEWGNRIQEAHAAYKAEPQQWGKRWDVWCKEKLGSGEAHLRQISCVSQNFRGNATDIQSLPADSTSLYALARLKRDAPCAGLAGFPSAQGGRGCLNGLASG